MYKATNLLTKMSRTRRYSELCRLRGFEERFDYLALKDRVGETTFGFDRWVNQVFYHSFEWRSVREQVIIRDGGCDLGILDYPIYSGLLIHHMNPMTQLDIIHAEDWIIDPEYLITTSHRTHNAIHFGDRRLLSSRFVERRRGDTRLW